MTSNHKCINSQITISNSGIVLVGPYLKTLFNHLELLNENDFRDLKSQKKAILLLNYIVSGCREIDLKEELVVFKILCGLDPIEEIKIDEKLEENEIRMLDSMLSSVLKKWEQLSTNSIDGFRESFLIREGDLTEDDEAYILLVDPKPFDILLDTLPWEYKSIKFPWMKKIIIISWN